MGARRDSREPARRLPAQLTRLRQEIAEGRVLPAENGQRTIIGHAILASERVRCDRQKPHDERLKYLFYIRFLGRALVPESVSRISTIILCVHPSPSPPPFFLVLRCRDVYLTTISRSGNGPIARLHTV